MARIQILELPAVDRPDGTMETPFALIIDQVNPDGPMYESLSTGTTHWLADRFGARTVLATEETIEIPANWATIDSPDGNVVRVRVEPDLTGFTEKVVGAVEAAQRQGRAALFNPSDYWLNIGDDSLTIHCRQCRDGIFENPEDRYHQCFVGGPELGAIHTAIQKHHNQHHRAE